MYKRETQLCVFLENKPGKFAEVCDLISAKGIDIRAMNVSPSSDFGVMRMVVDDSEAAVLALESEHVPFLESEVLTAEVPRGSGTAGSLGRTLANAGINIEYTYFSGGDPGSATLMVFMVSDIDQALEVLHQHSS